MPSEGDQRDDLHGHRVETLEDVASAEGLRVTETRASCPVSSRAYCAISRGLRSRHAPYCAQNVSHKERGRDILLEHNFGERALEHLKAECCAGVPAAEVTRSQAAFNVKTYE